LSFISMPPKKKGGCAATKRKKSNYRQNKSGTSKGRKEGGNPHAVQERGKGVDLYSIMEKKGKVPQKRRSMKLLTNIGEGKKKIKPIAGGGEGGGKKVEIVELSLYTSWKRDEGPQQ